MDMSMMDKIELARVYSEVFNEETGDHVNAGSKIEDMFFGSGQNFLASWVKIFLCYLCSPKGQHNCYNHETEPYRLITGGFVKHFCLSTHLSTY